MIDLFVDSLSIKDYGFRTDFIENGRPAYHPSDLLKLFIYGYLNNLRSSIQRSEYAEYYEKNHINIQEKEHLYKRRQTIVEHPYGTIKRSR